LSIFLYSVPKQQVKIPLLAFEGKFYADSYDTGQNPAAC
jgi:hypothetical protein